ncbi:MAG: chromate resistance protein, partial [Sulfuricaulis sp.]|nr:chromate resistance protein [Sulfuricaulis sp.]
ALGFDFDNAAFTHVGVRVTFEVLLASFGLDEDPALARLGGLVHYLDVGGVPVAEAAGLEMILNGARQQFVDDDKFLKEASRTFDFLYTSYVKE